MVYLWLFATCTKHCNRHHARLLGIQETDEQARQIPDRQVLPLHQEAGGRRSEDAREEDTSETLGEDSSVTSLEEIAAVAPQKFETPAVVARVEIEEEVIVPRPTIPAATPVEIAQASASESVPEVAEPLAAPAPSPASADTSTKISLDFKNADVHDVLRILADVSGLNIIATDDVKARVTLRLVEVSWDQALDVILQANGLEKSQSGNVLAVSTAKRLEEERNARLAARKAEEKLASLETVYLNINYVKATEIIKLVTREAAGGGSGGVALMSHVARLRQIPLRM